MSEKAAATHVTAARTERADLMARAEPGRVVERIGRALAVVPSLGPTAKAWRRLGFCVSEPFEFMSCQAFDVALAGGGIRFVAPPSSAAATNGSASPLASIVEERLVLGSGLLGWSWACASVRASRELVEMRANRSFELGSGGRKSVVVPNELTPGAVTLLEPAIAERSAAHPNRIERLDHVVLAVSDTDRVADAYASHFSLRVTRKTVAERRYAHIAFDAADHATIQIAGPAEVTRNRPSGQAWGVAFRSADLDATVRALRAVNVDLPEPYAALHGGRITGLPMSLGGIHIAFLGN